MDLRTLRKQFKLNQWDLTKETGISQTKISLAENGYVQFCKDEELQLIQAIKKLVAGSRDLKENL